MEKIVNWPEGDAAAIKIVEWRRIAKEELDALNKDAAERVRALLG